MQVTATLGTAFVIIAALVIIGATWFLRRHEAELEAEAERALPGPLRPVHRFRTRRSSEPLVTPPGSKTANQ
jgi:hypothetical protein